MRTWKAGRCDMQNNKTKARKLGPKCRGVPKWSSMLDANTYISA